MPSPFHDADIVLFLVVVYIGAVALGALYVIPSKQRERYRVRLQYLSGAASASFCRRAQDVVKACGSARTQQITRIRMTAAAVMRHKRPALLALAILVMPALAVQLFATRTGFDTYDDAPQATDPVIASLLQGERLVAPAPLPPDLFTTSEIESERHELATASRAWDMLDGDFRQRLLAVYRLMDRHGYQMVLLEGYRGAQRQEALARIGAHVTNAGAYQSYHQFGLAADSAFYRDGKIVISEKDPWAMEAYRLYGQYAEAAGLVWGGRWQMRDFGHVELRKAGIIAGR